MGKHELLGYAGNEVRHKFLSSYVRLIKTMY